MLKAGRIETVKLASKQLFVRKILLSPGNYTRHDSRNCCKSWGLNHDPKRQAKKSPFESSFGRLPSLAGESPNFFNWRRNDSLLLGANIGSSLRICSVRLACSVCLIGV